MTNFCRLNVLKVFDESMHCKDVYDHLSDPAGIVVNTMLKGFNVTLLTYSKAGLIGSILK